jgi:hypothetical protein
MTNTELFTAIQAMIEDMDSDSELLRKPDGMEELLESYGTSASWQFIDVDYSGVEK